MNSSVINSSRPFNQSSSGSSPQLSYTSLPCIYLPAAVVFLFLERSINLVVGYPVNIMVMCLALADARFCTISPICCYGYIILDFGYFDCLLDFTTGIINGSPLFLTCICLDRYVAVVHPIVFTSIKDKKIRVAISMLVWGLVIAYALCRSVLTRASNIQHHIYVGLILAAFTIMVYCNVSIISNLKKSVLGKEKMHPMKKKALRTVQIYLGIIVFHYLPVPVSTLLRYFTFFPEYCTVDMIIYSLKNYSSTTQKCYLNYRQIYYLYFVSRKEMIINTTSIVISNCISNQTSPDNLVQTIETVVMGISLQYFISTSFDVSTDMS